MSVEQEVVALTKATTDLLEVVTEKRAALDSAVTEAKASEGAAAASVVAANSSKVAADASKVAAATSAKAADDAAKRAAQITGLDTVAAAIGMAALPFPDVWLPLSDSLNMLAGYGDEIKVGEHVVARRASFSRNSAATYIGKDSQLKTAAANEPRFEREGLLIEGQSTNFVSTSNQITSHTGMTQKVSTTHASPSGLFDAIEVRGAGGSVPASLLKTFTANSDSVAVSFYIKVPSDSTAESLTLLFRNSSDGISSYQGIYKPATKSVTGAWKAEPLANDWVRLFLYVPPQSTTILGKICIFYMGYTGGLVIPPENYVLIYGMQAENSPFATSYIPTNGAAAARAADTLRIPYAGNGAPSSDTQITMSAVIKTNLRVGERTALFDALDVAPTFGVFVEHDGSVFVTIFDVQWNTTIKYDSTKAQVVAMSFNGATGAVSLRVGDTVVTGTVVVPNVISRSTGSIGLLCRAGTETRTGYGTVRDFKIWHKFFSVEQLRALK